MAVQKLPSCPCQTFPCPLVLCLLYDSSSLPSSFQNFSSCSLGISPAVDLSRSCSESRVFPHSRYHRGFMDLFKAAVSISDSVKQEVDTEGHLSLLDWMHLFLSPKVWSSNHCENLYWPVLQDLCSRFFWIRQRLTQEKETTFMQTDGSATFCYSFAEASATLEAASAGH